MATINNSSSSKPSTFYNNNEKDQYGSLNLNKSSKKPFLIPVQSYSKTSGNKKSYCNNDATQKKQKNNDFIRKDMYPKFVESLCNSGGNNGSRWKSDKMDSKNRNESTISLNISIYENSVEAKTDEAGYCNNEKKVVAKLNIIEKLQAFGIQQPFEIPRQQNDAPMEPEMSHFRASQRLLNPTLVNPVNPDQTVNPIAPVNSDEIVNQIEGVENVQAMENDDVEDASDGDEDDSDDDEEEVAGNESDLDDVDERGESGEDDTFCYGDMLNSVRRRKKKRVGVSKGGNDVENVDANAASLGESSVHLSGQAGEIVVGQGGGDAAPREEMVVTKRKPGRPKKNAENDQTKSRPGRPKRVADHPDENEVAHLTNLIQNTEEDYIYDMVLLHFNYPLDWCKNNQGPQKAKARRCIIAALHGKYGNHIKENSFKNKFNSAIQKARDKKELALRNGINNIEYTRAEYLILERTGPVLSEQIDVDDLGFGGVRRSNRRRKLTKIHTPATTSDDSVYVEPASKQRRDLHQAVEIHNDDLRADVSEEIISGSHQNDDFDTDAFDAFVVGENSRSTPPPGNYPSSTPLPLNTDPDSSLLMPPSPMAQRRLHFSDLFSPVSSDSFSITTEEERSFLSPTPVPVITPQAETPISGYNENSQTSPFLQYSNLSYNLTPMQPRSSSSSLQQQNQPILSPQQQPRSTPTFQQQQHQPILSPQQQPRSTPSFQQQQHQPILSPQQQPRSTPSFQQQQQRPVLTPQQQQQQQQPILSPQQQQQQQQQPILSPQQQRPVLTPQQRRLLPSFSLARTAPPRTAYGKNDVYNAAFRAQTSNEKSNADFQNLLQLHQRNASSNQELREQILRNLAIESENRAKISQIQLQNEQRSLIASNFFHPSMPRNLRPHNPSNLPSRSSSTPLQNPRNPNFLNSSYPNRRLED